MWRGAPLSDFADEPFAQAEASRLQSFGSRRSRTGSRPTCAPERRRSSSRATGAERAPPAERAAVRQLMLALYRSGRQAEALDVYRDLRMTLVRSWGSSRAESSRTSSARCSRRTPRSSARCAGGRCRAGRVRRPRGRASALLGALHDARDGRGGAVLISGEPGIGKSRLVDELTARARDDGMQVLRGRCWESGGAPAYWPWVQVLRASMRGVEPEHLRARLGAGASSWRSCSRSCARCSTTSRVRSFATQRPCASGYSTLSQRPSRRWPTIIRC